MTTALRLLIVGIGSHHGDDQAGWLVAKSLQSMTLAVPAQIRLASVPSDLLNWLADVDVLFLADAGLFEGPDDFVRMCWKDGQLSGSEGRRVEPIRARGTHGLDLISVLQLANTLGQMPSVVSLWVVRAGKFSPQDSVTEELKNRTDRVAAEMEQGIRILIGSASAVLGK